MKITIPATIEDATSALNGVEALLTAKEWERAAIIAAFVELPGSGSHNKMKGNSAFLTPNEFAALGIAGLKSHHTVRGYVERWVQEAGRPRPVPGESIDLDGLPEWRKPDPGTRYTPGKDEAVRRIREQPRTVANALSDPEFVDKILGLMSPEDVSSLAGALIKHGESEDDSTPRRRDPKPRDYGRLVESAINNLGIALIAAKSGRWEPTPVEEMLLYFATRMLGERVAPQDDELVVPAKLAATLDEIERYANAG